VNIDDQAKLFILCAHNLQQDEIFKAGGAPGPKFKSYDEMVAFADVIKSIPFFTPAKTKFKDAKWNSEK
jgi:hypothetical protein